MSRNLATVIKQEVERAAGAEARRALKPMQAELQSMRTQLREAETRLARLEKKGPAAAARRPAGTAGLDATGIREMRHGLGFTQADLAAVIGVTPVAVYLWESGRTSPRGRTLAGLSELKKAGVRKARRQLASAKAKASKGRGAARRKTKTKTKAKTKAKAKRKAKAKPRRKGAARGRR